MSHAVRATIVVEYEPPDDVPFMRDDPAGSERCDYINGEFYFTVSSTLGLDADGYKVVDVDFENVQEWER